MGVGRGAGGPKASPWILKYIAKKGCFLSFSGKKQMSPLLPTPPEQFWKTPQAAHPGKFLPTPIIATASK